MKDLVHKGPYLLNIHYDLYMKHSVESSSDPSSWAFNKSHMILVTDLVYKIVVLLKHFSNIRSSLLNYSWWRTVSPALQLISECMMVKKSAAK